MRHVAVFSILAAAGMVAACQSGTNSQGGSRILDLQFSGETPLSYSTTEGAYSYLTQNSMYDTSSLSLTDAPASPGAVQYTQLSQIAGKHVLIVFGYGKDEAAQLSGTVVPCSSLSGTPGSFAWKPNEQCIQPDDSGATGQLALLSCGTIDGQNSSCDSMTELLQLMGRTMFTQPTSGTSLTDNGAPVGSAPMVDTNFDNVGQVAGSRGNLEIDTAAGSFNFTDATINRYTTGQSLSLADGGGMLQVQAVSKANFGLVGYSMYEGSGDPISPAAGGDPNYDGVDQLSLDDGTGAPDVDGNVKLFIDPSSGS